MTVRETEMQDFSRFSYDDRAQRAQARRRQVERERERLCPFKPYLPSLRRYEQDLHLPSGDIVNRTLQWKSKREERLDRLRREFFCAREQLTVIRFLCKKG